MIVLRFTIGRTTREVRTPRTDVVVGSAPPADVTLPHAGLPGRALRLIRRDSEVEAEVLGEDQRITLRVGDAIELHGVEVALVGLLPVGPGPLPQFGGYEDDPALAGARTFQLADAAPSPAILPPAGPTPPPAATAARLPSSHQAPPEGSTRRSTAPRNAAAPLARADAPSGDATAPMTPEQRAALLKRLRFPEPTFGAELLVQLKRSPFYAISVGVHLLLLLALMLFDTTSSNPRLRQGPGAVTASLSAEEEELGREVPQLEDEGLPLEEMKLPDLDEILLEQEPPPTVQPPTPPSPFPEEVEETLPKPMEIGIMPGLRAASQRLRKRQPKMPAVDMKQTFTKGSAGSSNERSAEVVRAALGRGRGGNGATLQDLKPEDVLVVAGSFDHIGRVLDALRIKYVKKAPWSITAPTPEDFRSYKIVFWNCGESLGRRRMAEVGKRLREFVRDGGYLFTTDWSVSNVLPYAFPGYLKTNGNRAHLPEMVLTIEPARSAREHPLLEGVFHEAVQGKWWLEQASFDMSVGRPDAVTVLIESPMLKETFNRSAAVAATFHYGRGRVLHTMGHYFQEAGNLAGTVSAHRLALNFVLMRLDQDRPTRKR